MNMGTEKQADLENKVFEILRSFYKEADRIRSDDSNSNEVIRSGIIMLCKNTLDKMDALEADAILEFGIELTDQFQKLDPTTCSPLTNDAHCNLVDLSTARLIIREIMDRSRSIVDCVFTLYMNIPRRINK